MTRRAVIISAFHDYRTAKRASIHQVADGMARAGWEVSFVSTRFSHLSRLTGDSRLFLWGRANRLETVNGIDCLLWRTALHPFRSGRAALNRLMDSYYPRFAELQNPAFDQLIREADSVIVESSAAVIYLRRIRRLNPSARIIYYAADRLDTVGAHPFIQRRLEEDHRLIDHFSLRSAQMKDDFPWARDRLTKIGFGIDAEDYRSIGPSPYRPGEMAAVSVGSMLFDPTVFQLAAADFPLLQFHVIGCGTSFEAPSNVHIHAELPFEQTLPYVKHASIGIAPYRPAERPEYLADSSLKLAQFEHFGLPSVCPFFAVGSSESRIGYTPGDAASIRSAIAAAVSRSGHIQPRTFPSWTEVALQVLEPERYPEVWIGDEDEPAPVPVR